jgi:hypothetical protein
VQKFSIPGRAILCAFFKTAVVEGRLSIRALSKVLGLVVTCLNDPGGVQESIRTRFPDRQADFLEEIRGLSRRDSMLMRQTSGNSGKPRILEPVVPSSERAVQCAGRRPRLPGK